MHGRYVNAGFWGLASIISFLFVTSDTNTALIVLAVLIAGWLLILGRSPRGETARSLTRTAQLGIPYCTLGSALVVSTADVTGWVSSGPPWRYAFMVPGLCAAAAIDGTFRRKVDRLLPIGTFAGEYKGLSRTTTALLYGFSLLCLTYISCGTIMGTFNGDNYAVALPPAILLFYVAAYKRPLGIRLSSTPLTVLTDLVRINTRRSTIFSGIAMLFAAAALSDALSATTGGPPPFANHETIFILVTASLLATRFRKTIAIVSIAAIIVSTLRYATATLLLIALTAAALLLLSYLISGRSFKYAVFLAGPLLATGYLIFGQRIINSFYSNASRTNNSDTREELWSQGFDVLKANPLFGGYGSETITATALIDGRSANVPLHNSVLTLGVYGGAILIVLFGCLVFRGALAGIDNIASGGLTYVSPLLGLISATITLLFNPVLDQLGQSFFFYAALLWSVTQLPVVSSAPEFSKRFIEEKNHATLRSRPSAHRTRGVL
ncbi:hypothetical protein AB0362_06910 [Rhodococcus sp. NPDC079359]|uniref:hypothetical protein n=1 Tax=Rhodococcus sp. NPDC079359 TaxID=3154961 RepID=UPI00344B5E16